MTTLGCRKGWNRFFVLFTLACAIASRIAAAAPALGAHTLAYYRFQVNDSIRLSTAPITTQTTGSTIIASVGRGDFNAFATNYPMDNKANGNFVRLGSAHTYSLWGGSGTALYACSTAAGGSGHIVRIATPARDEVTMAIVEVIGAGHIQDFKWNEVLAGKPTTSLSVTTTGPAVLVAFWWGDAGVGDDKTAMPDNGFTITDTLLYSGALVQCAAAAKTVSSAGTYNVTWTSTPVQGAQLWLVAVQASASTGIIHVDAKSKTDKLLHFRAAGNDLGFALDPGESRYYWTVVDLRGRDIFRSGYTSEFGEQNYSWNGKRNSGLVPAAGMYFVHCRAGNYQLRSSKR